MKKIGLLSDIHGYWDPKFAHYFSSCDEIWIAGDIGEINVVENLEKMFILSIMIIEYILEKFLVFYRMGQVLCTIPMVVL